MAAAAGSSKASLASDDENNTIKVATKKETRDKPNGIIKLKKPAPKHNKPGNWRDGSVIDEDKKKGTDTPSTSSVPTSPGPVVNQLDDTARETFSTGRPLEDSLDSLQCCKHCKKSILRTVATAHLIACLKAKKEKAQRKKEQKEAREREKKAAGKEDDKDDEGDTKMEDDDDDDDLSPDKKGPGGLKSAKKSAGKKVELDDSKKGKKRKAEGDAEKGPKQKKKKEEPKPKAPKQKGISSIHHLSMPSTSPPINRVNFEDFGSTLSRPELLQNSKPEPKTTPPAATRLQVSSYVSLAASQLIASSSRSRFVGSSPFSSPSKAAISSPSPRAKGKLPHNHTPNFAERSPKRSVESRDSEKRANKTHQGPVDVERQCGVMKDGVTCARSLTCKSHSMGAKRAVAGRSLPYDMLLAAYQKKNQAKQQKAAIDANAPLEDEDAGAGPVDSDEELTLVMAGLSNWNPQPVVPPLVHVPIDRKYQKQRLYEQMFQATNGFTQNIFAVKGYGAQKLPAGHPGLTENGENGNVENDGMTGIQTTTAGGAAKMADRRLSGFNMQQPPQRKQSNSSQRG